MNKAYFRFYAELNDFLSQKNRQKTVVHHFSGNPGIKDVIEALGIPHVEVDLILVDDVAVDFGYRLSSGDRVAVYPVFESLNISHATHLSNRPLRHTAFLADAHLGKLSRLLRLLGFDTAYANNCRDKELIAWADAEERIILTRDKALLKHSAVTHGYCVRSVDSTQQAKEVLQRFDLFEQTHPFARCPSCNGEIRQVEKEEVLSRIPPKTAAWLDDYSICTNCGKLFWKGTHYQRLESQLKEIFAAD